MSDDDEGLDDAGGGDPTVESVRIIGDDASEPVLRFASADDLPHWSEPPTGEVPNIFAESDKEDLDAWATLPSQPPSWRDDRGAFSNVDFDDLGLFAEGAQLAAPDDPTDEADPPSGENAFLASLDEPASSPRVTPIRTRGADRNPPPSATSSRRAPENNGFTATRGTGGRNMPIAIGVGVALGGLFLALCAAGPRFVLGLIVAALVASAAELYASLRSVGYRPATLLGLLTIAALPLAIYWHGLSTVPVVLAVAVVTTLLWYLFADQESRPVPNIAVTLATVGYVGVLGSFGAAILTLPNGIGILLACVVCTVAFEVAGLLVGSSAGRTQLSPAVSPNKTWEGLIGGGVVTVVVAMLLQLIGPLHPWTKCIHAFQLGVVVAFAACLGDLTESMIKRDLGLKDMGTALPGHGGLLDRFDGLLFSLPATYLLCQVLNIF